MPTREELEAELAQKDVQAIGAHCDLSSCHRLDFLPFVCESCKGSFCLDHRTETAHVCPKAGAWLASRATTSSSSAPARQTSWTLTAPCHYKTCKTIIGTPREPAVACTACRKQFCLAHRLQDQHSCVPLPPPAPPAAEKAKAALSRFKLWGKEKVEKAQEVKLKRTAPNVAEMIKMKKEAKGDEKVPMDKRVYIYVEAEKKSTSSKMPKGTMWFNKDWSVGRCLDEAAKGLGVKNINNRADDEESRLRVFHVEGGRMLTFGEKAGDCLVGGNTIVLLRGVGVPDLLVD